MNSGEKNVIWEALVLIDAIHKNAISELNRLESLVLRQDIIYLSRKRIAESLGKVKDMLNQIPEKKRPVIELVGSKTSKIDNN